MKYLFLLFLPLVCQAQYSDDYSRPEKVDGVHRGDDLITITTDMDQDKNFRSFAKHLASHWYTFEVKDQELMTITTAPTDPGMNASDYKLNVRFVDETILIRVRQSGLSVGAALVRDVEIIWNDWHYNGNETNYMKKSFNHFYPILKAYGYPVSFSKQ